LSFSIGSLDPDPNPDWEFGSGSKKEKIIHKKEKKGSSCFEVLRGGLKAK
jgi:hypothetical protein